MCEGLSARIIWSKLTHLPLDNELPPCYTATTFDNAQLNSTETRSLRAAMRGTILFSPV
jgi:hypothetical protein